MYWRTHVIADARRFYHYQSPSSSTISTRTGADPGILIARKVAGDVLTHYPLDNALVTWSSYGVDRWSLMVGAAGIHSCCGSVCCYHMVPRTSRISAAPYSRRFEDFIFSNAAVQLSRYKRCNFMWSSMSYDRYYTTRSCFSQIVWPDWIQVCKWCDFPARAPDLTWSDSCGFKTTTSYRYMMSPLSSIRSLENHSRRGGARCIFWTTQLNKKVHLF
ncbi:hypothetical protein K440DRAFT_1892 [Wilcoxina mikolae CBS 423.85]|nr:hypothetical protein K440DRAFT_1892 [Wilcoxina mikolae CBS 423.85]